MLRLAVGLRVIELLDDVEEVEGYQENCGTIGYSERDKLTIAYQLNEEIRHWLLLGYDCFRTSWLAWWPSEFFVLD